MNEIKEQKWQFVNVSQLAFFPLTCSSRKWIHMYGTSFYLNTSHRCLIRPVTPISKALCLSYKTSDFNKVHYYYYICCSGSMKKLVLIKAVFILRLFSSRMNYFILMYCYVWINVKVKFFFPLKCLGHS